MPEVQIFKAQCNTHRFRANQKVWVQAGFGNHLYIRFKWRGKGRMVFGIIDRFAKAVGPLSTVDISDEFFEKNRLPA